MKKKENQLEREENTSKQSTDPATPVEEFYERFRDVPIRYLDIFIGCCVAALVLIVVLGALKGRGIL